MATTSQWVAGARLRTLPLAVAPVVAGTGAAIASPAGPGAGSPVRVLLALVVSLALQVGVNYANDYSDGIRGTDDERVGPFRLTGSRAARPGQVKGAAFAALGVAGLAGLALVVISRSWGLLPVGVACVVAAWFYTGGRRPYGYSGFGEVAVFVFFGLVAVLGTTYTQGHRITPAAVAAAVALGSLACAVLVANNLRDIPTDEVAGKVTLAVRLGDPTTRRFYLALVVAPFVLVLVLLPAQPWAALALPAAALALPPSRAVAGGATGLALLPVLRDTGRLALVYAVLLALGIGL